MPAATYRITTLGCRVNHAEARDIESVLLARGLVPAEGSVPADLEVVHSCSVTNQAAAKSRYAVRRAARRTADHPAARKTAGDENRHEAGSPAGGAVSGSLRNGAVGERAPHVIVTGCYATTHHGEAVALAGNPGRVIPHDAADQTDRDDQAGPSPEDGSTMIDRFSVRVDRWLGARPDPLSISAGTEPGPGSAPDLLPLPVVPVRTGAGAHQRAELRIQDGCDAHCTFCVIPKIRRTLRSKRVADAVAEARRLVDLGHREIVLSGIFIGAFGHETALRRKQARRGTAPLADLLDAVAQVPGLARLRISSMEPGDVGETLLDAMVANRPVVVPHLHLPLQSGSDAVLRRMNRQYGVADYLEMLAMVEAALTEPGDTAHGPAPLPPALTTDVICGFPGETDDDFARTVAVADRAGYLHMHVFPYSAKRGTAAARWRDRFVPDDVKKKRVRTLLALEDDPADGLSLRFRRRLLGRRVRVILEQPAADEPGIMTGRCDHYALVHVRTDRPRGAIVEATVTEVTPDRTVAEVAPLAVPLPILAR